VEVVVVVVVVVVAVFGVWALALLRSSEAAKTETR
jgi:hypothetical protein